LITKVPFGVIHEDTFCPLWTGPINVPKLIQKIKNILKNLSCLEIPHPQAQMIAETDASDIGYGEIFKQKLTSSKQLVHFHSGIWLRS
jgi:hypothetical protein